MHAVVIGDFDGFLRDLGGLHAGSFDGDATGRHVGDAVSIGCTGHAGVGVDVGVGTVKGVIDSSAVGDTALIGVGVDVCAVEGVIDSSAVGDTALVGVGVDVCAVEGVSDGASVNIFTVGAAVGAENGLKYCIRVISLEVVKKDEMRRDDDLCKPLTPAVRRIDIVSWSRGICKFQTVVS